MKHLHDKGRHVSREPETSEAARPIGRPDSTTCEVGKLEAPGRQAARREIVQSESDLTLTQKPPRTSDFVDLMPNDPMSRQGPEALSIPTQKVEDTAKKWVLENMVK